MDVPGKALVNTFLRQAAFLFFDMQTLLVAGGGGWRCAEGFLSLVGLLVQPDLSMRCSPKIGMDLPTTLINMLNKRCIS